MNTKSIYVILVNYNGLNDTIECICSIRKGSFDNYKIVVVDNNSAKDTINELTDMFDDIVIIRNEQNVGFAKANNKGILYAIEKGADYILLLNNDTVVKMDFLKKMLNRAEMLSAGALTCKIMYSSDHKRIWYGGGEINWKRGYGIHYTDNRIRNNSKIEFASGCCIMLNRHLAETVMLPEDYFMYFEDVDYCVQLQERGFSIYYTSDVVIYHKISASSGVESPFFIYYWNRNRIIFMKKYKYKIGNYRYSYWMAKFLASRVLKVLGYILHGENEKRKRMVDGVKAGLTYKIIEQ